MPEIKHQVLRSAPGIESAEIHIPDDSDLGTGTFTTKFLPNKVPPVKGDFITSAMINVPIFQITATLNTNLDVPVLLGTPDKPPRHTVTFRLPLYVKRNEAHVLTVKFAKWLIFHADLDGTPLLVKGEQTH